MLRDLLRIVANRCSCEVETVPDGLQALQRLQERTYDVLVLDLMMPVVSGYDVIPQLREMENRPAVIVVTAMTTDTYLNLDAGVVTATMRKPFDVEYFTVMLNGIASAMAHRRASDDEATSSSDDPSNVVQFPPC